MSSIYGDAEPERLDFLRGFRYSSTSSLPRWWWDPWAGGWGTDCGGLIWIPPLVLWWGLFHAPCLFHQSHTSPGSGTASTHPSFFSHCRLISASGNAVDQNLFLSSQPLLVDIYRDCFSVLGKMPTNIYSLTWGIGFCVPICGFYLNFL